jgi:ribosome biogenesis protein MAK21
MAMKKGGKGEAVKAVRALVDWWVGGGAPERKLRYDISDSRYLFNI